LARAGPGHGAGSESELVDTGMTRTAELEDSD
jgi:hypothetical protein